MTQEAIITQERKNPPSITGRIPIGLNRLVLQHSLFEPLVANSFEEIIDVYGLGDLLRQVKAAGNKGQILDVGCGIGHELEMLAALLDARKLLGAAELSGLETNQQLIITAEQNAKAVNRRLNYYLGDASLPLSENLGLMIDGKVSDLVFIYAAFVLEYLPNPKDVVIDLYKRLRPGGCFYSTNVLYEESERGWFVTHDYVTEAFRISQQDILAKHGLINIGYSQAEWLAALGAEQIKVVEYPYLANYETEDGKLLLKNLLTMADFERDAYAKSLDLNRLAELRRDLYSKLGGPEVTGQMTIVTTMARKPLA